MSETPIYIDDDDDVEVETEAQQVVRSSQMFLPGEAGGWTPVPHPLLNRLIKSAATGEPDRSAAVDAYVRKNVGRRDRGSYRAGVIDGLTISLVAQLLACDRSNARRILGSVIENLGGNRIGDGKFQFSSTPAPTPPGTPGRTPPITTRKRLNEGELPKVTTPDCAPPSTPPSTPPPTPGTALKPAPTGGLPVHQDDQYFQTVQNDQPGKTSSVPPGEVVDSRPSDGAVPAGPQEHPADGRTVPDEHQDIPPTAGVPVREEVFIPGQDKGVLPEKVTFVSRWNRMCRANGHPERQIETLTTDQISALRDLGKVIRVKAVDYMAANPKFKDLTWSINTLVKPGTAVNYAEKWDSFYGKARTTSSPTKKGAETPEPATTGKDMPPDLKAPWARLQAFQGQIELPEDKLPSGDWQTLVSAASAKVSVEDIAVRYEARIRVCKAEGRAMQHWPSLRTFIKNGGHLLPPAKVSASTKSKKPKESLSRAEREIRDQREAGGDTGWDVNTDSSNVLDDILGDQR